MPVTTRQLRLEAMHATGDRLQSRAVVIERRDFSRLAGDVPYRI
jgi:hypothetical protein